MKNEMKMIKNNLISKIRGRNYGFIDEKYMPKGDYIFNHIDYKGINWVSTNDLEYGKDHCAATTGTNIALYYDGLGYFNIIKDDEKDVFHSIYKFIGNGPVIFLARKLKRYFNSIGYNLKYKRYTSFEELKKSIDKNKPSALLLSASLLNWHWVLAIGWREYKSGDKYIQIVDSWHKNRNRFLKIKESGRLISATEYWINRE